MLDKLITYIVCWYKNFDHVFVSWSIVLLCLHSKKVYGYK